MMDSGCAISGATSIAPAAAAEGPPRRPDGAARPHLPSLGGLAPAERRYISIYACKGVNGEIDRDSSDFSASALQIGFIIV